MGRLDFQAYFSWGSYGGLACALAVAATLAVIAQRHHLGTPRQLARAMLFCLSVGALAFVPVWWNQNRLQVDGPTLGQAEVALFLIWTALLGWCAPLGMLIGYLTFATPVAREAPRARFAPDVPAPASLDDAARHRTPLGTGRAWGRLVPLDGDFAERPLPLTQELTLIGREFANDIVIEDERSSRFHAEVHWDHGHPHLLDRGSMNGTFINGQAVRGSVPLQAGDVLEIGTQRYRFEQVPAGEVADAEEPLEVQTAKLPRPAARAQPTVALAGPHLRLSVVEGPLAGSEWTVNRSVTLVGRDESATVRLPDLSVSRRHAQIVRQADGYFYSDLQSANGTVLNGEPLTAPTLLRSGDVLEVGAVTLTCTTLPATHQPPADASLHHQSSASSAALPIARDAL